MSFNPSNPSFLNLSNALISSELSSNKFSIKISLSIKISGILSNLPFGEYTIPSLDPI